MKKKMSLLNLIQILVKEAEEHTILEGFSKD